MNESNGTASQVGAPEVEVTPAMIAAGKSVLCDMELSFASEDYWVEKIYRAMTLGRPTSSVA